MTTNFLRLTNPKRVKLVSTCDICKSRKVKCDKERPECGTCKRTNRKCSYNYAQLTKSMRDKQNGMKSQNDKSYLDSCLEDIQKVQFGPLFEESGYLSMVSRGFGVDINEGQNIVGMLSTPTIPLQQNDGQNFSSIDGTSVITSEVLYHSSEIASNIPRVSEQCLYDPTYYLNCADFAALTKQVPHQEQFLEISPEQMPPLAPSSQQHQNNSDNKNSNITNIDAYQNTSSKPGYDMMEDLISSINNINLYESTRYIGEGSLLMLDEDYNGEMIIPQTQARLSEVDDSLKILPDPQTVEELISLYYKNVHRYFPVLREKVVYALRDLSKSQHLLLLNCIFFAASPFQEDPEKRDGRIYFERAEALLYEYCTQPHVLTVIAIILMGRYNKQPGAGWMYNGIATKMVFELGLHRKPKNLKIKMEKDVEMLRNEAFWVTFISENFISATYGRPNMIDETDCDVDVTVLPPEDQNLFDEKTKLRIAFIHLINLSRICARVRKYVHAASRLKFLIQEDENKFRVLDAALASWFHSLPDWLKFEEISKDPNGTLLNGIGGDLHIFFYTTLIQLHSRYLKHSETYDHNSSYLANSPVICIQSATIIVHWLEILLSKHPNFFAFSMSGPFAIDPSMRVFSWHAKHNENDKKSTDMLQRLQFIKSQVEIISRGYDRGRKDGSNSIMSTDRMIGDWLGITVHPHNGLRNGDVEIRDWEVFVSDDDKILRKQYSMVVKKQSGGPFMPKRHGSLSYPRGSRHYGSSKYDYFGSNLQSTDDQFNFTFKSDEKINFCAFQPQQNQQINCNDDDRINNAQ
nr:532_t:CDS:2 [Entrophospora candida]